MRLKIQTSHIRAAHHDRFVLHGSQSDMQNGAFLGDVDLIAAKHGIDPLAQTGLIREFEQQPDGLIGDAVL
jgi:hypothetical protein